MLFGHDQTKPDFHAKLKSVSQNELPHSLHSYSERAH